MKLYRLDPTRDSRWNEFVQAHPKASVFHSVGWLSALRDTYGYRTVVFTTSSPTEELRNGVVFCQVNSWLTGRRLVSLPFSDHCDPLCDSQEELCFMMRYLRSSLNHEQLKYVELRPTSASFDRLGEAVGFLPVARYLLHRLDLRPDLDQVFQGLDKDCVRRRIRRADRAGLVEESGATDALLRDFYDLFKVTRSRHHLPPVPYAWFQNLIRCQGEALEIRVAYWDEKAIAAILTLRHKGVLYYKYGCSDIRYKRLAAMPWLLWRAAVAAKSNGAVEFDLGRTQEDNPGLLAFKNHWVQRPSLLVYWNCPGDPTLDSIYGRKLRIAKRVFSWMPDSLLAMAGRLIYRHIG